MGMIHLFVVASFGRFLSKYPDYPVDGQAMEISLDAVSRELSKYK